MLEFNNRRFWKRIAIALGIVAGTALIANSVLSFVASRRLQAKIAALRSSGQPASISDLAPQPIPDDQNAAAILKRLEPRLAAFKADYVEFYDSPVGKAYDDAPDGATPTAEQIAAIRAILNKYEDVNAALAKAAACEKYASQLDFSLNNVEFVDAMVEHWNGDGGIRTAARFLGWKAEVALFDRQPEQAVHYGLTMHRLARLYESEPSVVSTLIAIAIRGMASTPLYDALASGSVSPELHGELDQELARQDDPNRLRRTLITERALCADSFQSFPDQPSYVFAKHIGWLQMSYQLGAVEFLDELLATPTLQWNELRTKLGDGDTPRPTGHGTLADLLVPAFQAAIEANERGIMLSRAMRIHNALRQFKEKNGTEARGLDDLPLPAEAKTDPYTGQPMKLKQSPHGWIIYSVMGNGTDDGGDFTDLKDFGLAPMKHQAI